jgi:hypothetical protein
MAAPAGFKAGGALRSKALACQGREAETAREILFGRRAPK